MCKCARIAGVFMSLAVYRCANEQVCKLTGVQAVQVCKQCKCANVQVYILLFFSTLTHFIQDHWERVYEGIHLPCVAL